jgi:hypothetical protein
MTAEEVQALLGAPLERTVAEHGSKWRYYERANPRWCDGGSSKAKPPEYSIEVTLLFEAGILTTKNITQSGTPAYP